MKIKVNKNFFWAEKFVNELSLLGVKHVSISPGSRNTALTLAFTRSSNFKCYANIDERSSAFFALGLAQRTCEPVAVLCTSGTASAELYPAIIEAYYQRIPLIIITADRPRALWNKGVNQTIKQDGIYSNHIRAEWSVSEPVLTPEAVRKLVEKVIEIVTIGVCTDRGPVHFNFPIDKPFEPATYTDEIKSSLFDIGVDRVNLKNTSHINPEKEELFIDIVNALKSTRKGIIIAGPAPYNKEEARLILELGELLKFPIFVDSMSNIRFSGHANKYMISSYADLLRTDDFKYSDPEICIHFGRTPISVTVQKFIRDRKVKRYIINKYRDNFQFDAKVKGILACSPVDFCRKAIEVFKNEDLKRNINQWCKEFTDAEKHIQEVKDYYITQSDFPGEPSIPAEIVHTVPEESILFISNSLPIRDFDHFAPPLPKRLHCYSNRGASGIDGIISTAAGIAAAEMKETFLVIGDVAFYYDLNALAFIKKNDLPVTIILINNNGGHIFDTLPVAGLKEKAYNKFFVTPTDLNFKQLTKAFGIPFYAIESWKHFEDLLSKRKTNGPRVLEIKTDNKTSIALKKEHRKQVERTLKKKLYS